MTDDYVLLGSRSEVKDAVADLMARRLVGLDFETTGIDPRRDVPLLLGMDEYVIRCNEWPYSHPGNWAELVRPLVESTDTVKVEWNANFEGMIFEAVDIHQKRVVDPMLGDQLLHAGFIMPRGFFTLGQALQRYLYIEHDKTLQTSFIGADPATFVPTDAQLRYLRRDTGYLPQLSDAIARKVSAEGMMDTWKLENRYSQVLAMMQYHGVLVDVDGYRVELEKVNAEFDKLEREVSEALTPHILEVRRRRYQALKGPEDEWKSSRASAYCAIESGKLSRKLSLNLPGQAARDWELEQQRLWKEANPKPPVAKMNHQPILVTSHDQVYTALNEMGIQVENTERDTLTLAQAGRSADQVEILKKLGELAVVNKVRANEGPELLLRLQDGNLLTTRFHQLRARTGRISSSKWSDTSRCADCGLQQQGIQVDEADDGQKTITCQHCGRTAGPKSFGKQWGANNQNLTARFKRYVLPGPGRRFVIYDYSQIELRVAADLILQENPHASDMLVKAFRDGLDPHCLTGEEVTGVAYAEFHRRCCEVKADADVKLRRGMKVVNFSTLFGTGAPKMAVKIYVDTGDDTAFGQAHIDAAQKRIDAFWRINPTLAAISKRVGAETIRTGIAETLGGRRRYFDVQGINGRQRGGIARQAISTRIQGTAADIAKEAQNMIWEAVVDTDPDAWLWNAEHDAIGLECLEQDADDWDQVMPVLMDRAFKRHITHIASGIVPGTGVQDRWTH